MTSDWLDQDGLGFEDEPARERYKYFMRPEPKEGMGPIEVGEDGRRFRYMDVGMVRNPKPENRKRTKVILDPLPHIVLEQGKPLQGWYKSKYEPPGVRARPCFTDAILTEPYGGYCTVGCAFCYINSGVRGYRGSGLITVPQDYGAQVAKQLRSMRTSAAGYFSSFTDPFLPLEDWYHNTQQGAEAFAAEGLPVFFLSRLSYPYWAYDILRMNKYSYAQKSINTPDPDDWHKLSPAAITLYEHFEEIKELHEAGIYVSIQVNPVVAGITSHEDIERLIHLLAQAGADHVIVKFVEAAYSWVPAMVDRMTKRFGDNRAAAFRDLFVDNIGGVKTIAEEYRLEGHRRYQRAARDAGVTYATCYEYKYQRDAAGAITSKTGVSIGGDFLTADQCHGHRVPIFTRRAISDRFAEVAACPPSGCLACSPAQGAPGACGSIVMGEAKALRLPDLRKAL